MTDGEREHWSRLLVKIGWLFTLAEVAVAAAIVNRARAVTTSSFEDGVWGQRAEILSFLSLPQNVVVLVPAAAAAAAATLIGRGTLALLEPWLDRLLRLVAGLALAVIALGVVGIIDVLARAGDSFSDFNDIVNRLGGIVMGIAAARLCLESERSRTRAN
ncbi:MAG TPA: hypothetical protein VNO51_20300 [Ilumatobacteraceae bacterium]|nr:hypothetical protein [Ilumatobacteraceae bacterium]